MRNKLELTGQRFTRLLVIRYIGVDKKHHSLWECLCDCGTTKIVQGSQLVQKLVQSCNCLQKTRAIRHGLSETKFWKVWKCMIDRCATKRPEIKKNYADRGITIDPKYLGPLGFEAFRDDFYQEYLEHVEKFGKKNTTFDRIENDGNYTKDNCRWTTKEIQNLNRRNMPISLNYDEHKKQRQLLSRYLTQCVSLNTNSSRFQKAYGCTVLEFKKHIESQFTNGMTWDNYGMGKDKWCFDHIIPCHQFDLSKEVDRLVCYNFVNMRPLWWIKNVSKVYKGDCYV